MLELKRSVYYYKAKPESKENLEIMRQIDEQYMKTPFYGVRRMCNYLRSLNYKINEKRVRRLMRLMGLEAIYPKPHLSKPDKEHKIYPYLLRGVEISHADKVWSSDITYIPLLNGFMYLVAVIDWYSRYILSWRLSNTLEESFCISALEDALSRSKPEIFNTDQGSQFTSNKHTGVLEKSDILISMDSRGRALDNVYIERFWWSLKYEDIYLHSYTDGKALYKGIESYINFYNNERPHQSLGYRTPAEVYFERLNIDCSHRLTAVV